MSYTKHSSMAPNKSPLRRREIRILESSSSMAARSSALLGGSSSSSSRSKSSKDCESRFETSPRDPTTSYRKLRRRNGDYNSRGILESNRQQRCHCSASSNQNGIAKAVGMVNQFVLVLMLLLFLQIGSPSIGWTEAAYLNGVNSDLPSKGRPPRTTTQQQPPPPIKNERYAFASRPTDKYFTATGTLPPLPPSSADDDEQDPKAPWYPPMTTTRSTASERDAITVTYTNDPDTVDSWLCHNVPYDGCFLGFDIERLPECRSSNPDRSDRSDFAHAAVVQLATLSSCLVVHLVDSGSTVSSSSSSSSKGGEQHHHHHHHHYPKHSNACARILRTALEDTSIVKAGCSIDEDLVLLHELWGKPRGSKSIHVRTTNRKRGGSAKADASSDPSHRHQTKDVRGDGGGGNRSRRTNHHHNHSSKSRKEKGIVGKTMRDQHQHDRSNSHHHGLSLRARSRFDLGCVVLTNHKANTGSNDGTNDGNVPDEAPGCGRPNERDPRPPPHFKIMAKRTTSIQNKSGLQGLCKSILGIDLPKEKEDCKSDWTRFPLTDDQITYAARDAWAGVAIATELASMSVERGGGGGSNNSSIDPMKARPGQQHGADSSGTPGNDVFSLSNLIRVLGKSETPLPHLAERHRQRKRAKTELQSLLHPYARNQFLNQQNERRHRELLVLRQQQQQQQNQSLINGTTTTTNDDDKIDVQALFAGYPLSSQRSLANYGQKQQQLMEKSLPKRIRKRTLVLRQMVNARVIDHNLVFEIKLVPPEEEDDDADDDDERHDAVTGYNGKQQKRHPRHNHTRGRWRRNRGGASESGTERR